MLISKSTDEGYIAPFNIRNVFYTETECDIYSDNLVDNSGWWYTFNSDMVPCNIDTEPYTGGSGSPITMRYDKYMYIVNINSSKMKKLTYTRSTGLFRQDYWWKFHVDMQHLNSSGVIIFKRNGSKRYISLADLYVTQNVDLEPDDSFAIIILTVVYEKTNGKTANLIPTYVRMSIDIEAEEES